MFRGIKLLKRYYSLAGIAPSLLIFQFILILIPALLSLLSPAFLANIISSLTVYDFSKAIYILSLDFIVIIISALLYLFYHLITRKINRTLYIKFNDYLYENIKKNKKIKNINLPIITNVAVCIKFNKNFLFKLCFLIKAIFTLILIAFYNYIISIGLIIISFVSYLFLRISDKKIQNNTKELTNIEQQTLELFNSIHKGGEIEENYNLNTILKNKYFGFVEKQIKTNNKISFLYSINNNFISLILKAGVFVATIYLINQIKATTLTLSLYLILTPYLTSSAQNLISFFDLFSEFGNIENILDEFESLEFKDDNITNTKIQSFSNYNFYLYHIFFNYKNASLKDINLDIKFGKSILIYSKDKSSLLAMSKIFERNNEFEKGSIFIDDKNAADLQIEEYRKITAISNANPFFYNLSIIENLLMVCSNKKFIIKSLKDFKLFKEIQLFKDKENTIINDSMNKDFLFLLDLLRSYLSGAKLICVNQIPSDCDSNFYIKLSSIIQFLKNKCSLVLLSNKKLNLPVDKILTIENEILK